MTTKPFRLALPRCNDLEHIEAHLASCGFAKGKHRGTTIHYTNPLDDGVDFEVFNLNEEDIGTYVQHGIVQIGVMSTDVLLERDVDVWRPYTFNFGSYPIIFGARRTQTLNSLNLKPNLRLASPIPRYTRDWFTQRGVDVEVVQVRENVHEAVSMGLADGFVDRLTDPDDLLLRGFHALERVGMTHMKLVVNNALSSKRRATIGRLIACLESTKPADQAPIIIPFDSEDIRD